MRAYPLENRSYQSDDIDYKFTGKQRDAETGGACPDMLLIGNYFGARYYDAKIGRWGGVDPLYIYFSYSPYCYVNNCPLSFIDPDGREIDPFTMMTKDRVSYDKLKSNVSYLTGLTLIENSSGNLDYVTKNGEPVVSGGSKKARDLFIAAVKSKTVFRLMSESKEGSSAEGNETDGYNINLNPEQIEAFIAGTHGLNPNTHGWAMVFFHEIGHTSVGGNLTDPMVDYARKQFKSKISCKK